MEKQTNIWYRHDPKQNLVEWNFQKFIVWVGVWIPIYNPKKKPLNGNEVLQEKPHTGQGRVRMRRMLPPINQAITQTSELSKKIPDVWKMEMRITNQAHSTAPAQSITNSYDEVTHRSPMIKDIPFYPDSTYKPLPKTVRIPTPESSYSSESTYIDPEINIDFEENSLFQEGIISEIYQRPEKTFFQEC